MCYRCVRFAMNMWIRFMNPRQNELIICLHSELIGNCVAYSMKVACRVCRRYHFNNIWNYEYTFQILIPKIDRGSTFISTSTQYAYKHQNTLTSLIFGTYIVHFAIYTSFSQHPKLDPSVFLILCRFRN